MGAVRPNQERDDFVFDGTREQASRCPHGSTGLSGFGSLSRIVFIK
jgi:hypothetical protein